MPQVLFVCSDSSLLSLCPVAPFHATISSAAVAQLLHAIRDEPEAAQSTTHAWLDQVGWLTAVVLEYSWVRTSDRGVLRGYALVAALSL